jgi:hypothetical protein
MSPHQLEYLPSDNNIGATIVFLYFIRAVKTKQNKIFQGSEGDRKKDEISREKSTN